MKHKYVAILTLILLVLFLNACGPTKEQLSATSAAETIAAASPTSSITPSSTPTATYTPTPAFTPTPADAGKAAITGRVMHEEGYAMVNTIVRLGDVARGAEGRGGKFILDLARSPGTFTDQNGYFNIQNLDPGEYVIVVGDIEITGVYQIITEESGSAKIWNLVADQVTDIGTILVNIYPPTPFPTAIPGVYPAPTAYPNP